MPRSIVTMGIDPGTRRVGYGIIRREGNTLTFLDAGILKIKSSEDAAALTEAKREMDKLIKKYRPGAVGIEKLFFAKNQRTGIAVAQARGVILLAATEGKIPVKEYTPNEVKLGVTGYGLADKKAVLKMVRLTLGTPDLAVIDDASDALALAIMAANRSFSGD
jgi:crossover junction endodeoxyribonuclease RuvC